MHVCNRGHFQIPELLRFVQYLREHDEAVAEYGRLKLEAGEASDFDNAQYMVQKRDWIRATVRTALAHCGDLDDGADALVMD